MAAFTAFALTQLCVWWRRRRRRRRCARVCGALYRHRPQTLHRVAPLRVGRYRPPQLTPDEAAYAAAKAELVQAVHDAGLFRVDRWFYVHTFALPLACFALAAAAIFGPWGDAFWVHSVFAPLCVALAWHQAAWLGHDLMVRC